MIHRAAVTAGTASKWSRAGAASTYALAAPELSVSRRRSRTPLIAALARLDDSVK